METQITLRLWTFEDKIVTDISKHYQDIAYQIVFHYEPMLLKSLNIEPGKVKIQLFYKLKYYICI